jgi:hypothetical protein
MLHPLLILWLDGWMDVMCKMDGMGCVGFWWLLSFVLIAVFIPVTFA